MSNVEDPFFSATGSLLRRLDCHVYRSERAVSLPWAGGASHVHGFQMILCQFSGLKLKTDPTFTPLPSASNSSKMYFCGKAKGVFCRIAEATVATYRDEFREGMTAGVGMTGVWMTGLPSN